jgi:hypothetical protein
MFMASTAEFMRQIIRKSAVAAQLSENNPI